MTDGRIMIISKQDPFAAQLLTINSVNGDKVYGDVLDEEGIGSSKACEYVSEDVLLNNFTGLKGSEEDFDKLLKQAIAGELELPLDLE